MNAREVIAAALRSYTEGEDAAEIVERILAEYGFTIMSKEDVEAVLDKALEDAAQIAECHSDDRARRYSMDWNDGYIDGCKGAAAAIRSLKSSTP